MADGTEVHERVTTHSGHELRFEHVRVPLPVRASAGTFLVHPVEDGDRAEVVLDLTFEPLDPAQVQQISAGVRAAFQQSLDSLRIYVEEKTAWDAR
jgi:Polyketide cyclase / dehydrase and lipid transport